MLPAAGGRKATRKSRIFNIRFELTLNRTYRITGAFVLAVVLWNGQPANAQRLAEGAIRGWVRTETGAPVSEALVTLRDRLTGATKTIQAARWGEFVFDPVASGEYDVTIEAFGRRPLRLEGVPVRGGETTQLESVLHPGGPEAAGVEVRHYAGGVSGTGGRFTARDLERYPWRGRDLGAFGRVSSGSDDLLGVEGLPGSMTPLYVNGVQVGSSVTGSVPVFPLTAFRQVEFESLGADVEWSGATGGVVAQTIGANSRLEIRTFGDWITGAKQTGSVRGPVYSGLQAGAVVSGPLVADTSSFVLGVETWRLETPISFSPRLDSLASMVGAVADETYGEADARPVRLARTEAISGFGRFDWRFSDNVGLSANFAFTSMPKARWLPSSVDRAGAGTEAQGADAFLSASLATRFTDRFGQDLRLAWDRTVREYGPGETPSTLFVHDALAVGSDPLMAGRYAVNTLRLREALQYFAGNHLLKAGFSADFGFHEHTLGSQGRNAFWFSSTDAFAAGTGYVVRTTGESEVTFELPRYGIFVQDEVSFGSRLKVLAGLRWDKDDLPRRGYTPNVEWYLLTGIGDERVPRRRGRISPRFEIDWRPDAEGRWFVRGSAGVWDAGLDPLLFGDLLANNGGTRVYRAFGAFADWPETASGTGRPSLTLVATGFQGARSTRAAVQVSHRLTPAIEVQVGGVMRRTEMLPRRVDLNRAMEASGTDQYGRPIYGTLVQQGAVLTAEPGSNRRFAAFDIVSSIGVDGWSEYKGAHAAVNARVTDNFSVEARYTFSETRDNWFMARELPSPAAVSPFAADENGDWTEGVSDFDIPHRAVIGAELNFPVMNGIRVAGLYRIQSGQPFTPGFRDGVDANGDGSMRNDPAYIDPDVPGFAVVSAEWDCIRSNAGSFAPRNACRAETASFLDARLAIGLFGGTFGRAELVIDAINLVSRGAAIPDHSLYLVDPSGTLSREGNVTTVPIVTNPGFGAPLVSTSPGRMFRIGLSLKY